MGHRKGQREAISYIRSFYRGGGGRGSASHLRIEAGLILEIALVLVQYYDTKTERLKKVATSFFSSSYSYSWVWQRIRGT